jgi:hypothetical protein
MDDARKLRARGWRLEASGLETVTSKREMGMLPALRLDTPEKRPCVAQDALLRAVSQTHAVGLLAFAPEAHPASRLGIR